MGTLTTNFIGLCTHIQKPAVTEVPHRCVLVNGMIPATINDHPLATHVATLTLNHNDILETPGIHLPPQDDLGLVTWQIDGASLSILNTIPVPPHGVVYTAAYMHGIPSLTTLTTDLGLLSAEVVTDRNPTLASCYFDVDGGTFDGGATPGVGGEAGAAMAILTTTVTDPNPVISVSSFTMGSGTITLRSGAEMTVANVGFGPGADSDFDFLLQYRVFPTIPADAGVPKDIDDILLVVPVKTGPAHDVGPGCSNSNYP
jgi:hypothetical protein